MNLSKQILFFSLVVGLNFNSIAQNVKIPDANFKAYLISRTDINTNGDNEIQVSEAAVFEDDMNVSRLDIVDLTGIEYFTSITYLDCERNQLAKLNVSMLKNLSFLNCFGNQLTSLSFSSTLNSLNCSQNQLISLDVSMNKGLLSLACGKNPLKSLNMKNGNNANLELLYVDQLPNLSCIQVDDPKIMNENWAESKDATTKYSTSCGNDSKKK